MTIKISSHQDVLQFGLGVKVMRMRYERWLQTVVMKILEDEILVPIWDAMRSHNYSYKIIEGTDISEIIRQGHNVKVRVRSVYTAIDAQGGRFDVARAREYGTKPHWIEPRGKNNPTNAKGDNLPKALSWVSAWGEHLFSKGHVVGGIEARHLVERIVNRNMPKVKLRIKEEFKAWKEDIFNT